MLQIIAKFQDIIGYILENIHTFLFEIMILYLYKKTSITENQVYLNTIKAHPGPSQIMGT